MADCSEIYDLGGWLNRQTHVDIYKDLVRTGTIADATVYSSFSILDFFVVYSSVPSLYSCLFYLYSLYTPYPYHIIFLPYPFLICRASEKKYDNANQHILEWEETANPVL